MTRASLSRRLALAAALAWATFHVAHAAPARPPNILLIVADDLGYADLGVHGCRDIPTPHLDALGRGGVRFSAAYVSGTACSPSRAGLLTGRYQQRFGYEFGNGPTDGLPLEERTLADRLKAAGYRTALFGKWHLGSTAPFHPFERGFDEFFGFLGGLHSYLEPEADSDNPLLDGRTPVARTAYLTEALADRAVDFIGRCRDQPFFLYLAFNAVHGPPQVPDRYLSRFAHIADERRRTYAAMLSALDDAVGRTLSALRAQRLEKRTLVFFLSDNGGPTMDGTTINGASNAPFRGSKRQTWEGGIRVPFFLRWKGNLPARRVDARPIIQLDVVPTVLAAAGLPPPAPGELDGVDLLPFLASRASRERPHDTLYWRTGDTMAIRRGDWKLVKTTDGRPGPVPPTPDLSDAGLYNLADDPGEQRDLAAAEPERAEELAEAWRRWNLALVQPRGSVSEPD